MIATELMPPEVEISFDLQRVDFAATFALIKASYWGGSREEGQCRRAFANSLCAAAYVEGRQVAFGRAVTDYAVFAYLADVIVWPEHRGKGVGPMLIKALLDHPRLTEVGHWCLNTADAHALYERFGFVPSTEGRYMRLDRQTRQS